jgi:hypothetical protein
LSVRKATNSEVERPASGVVRSRAADEGHSRGEYVTDLQVVERFAAAVGDGQPERILLADRK